MQNRPGEHAGKSGVYILHSNGKILHIEKTVQGKYGSFAERPCRYCQEKFTPAAKHLIRRYSQGRWPDLPADLCQYQCEVGGGYHPGRKDTPELSLFACGNIDELCCYCQIKSELLPVITDFQCSGLPFPTRPRR